MCFSYKSASPTQGLHPASLSEAHRSLISWSVIRLGDLLYKKYGVAVGTLSWISLLAADTVPFRSFHPERTLRWPLENVAEAPAWRLHLVKMVHCPSWHRLFLKSVDIVWF